MKTAHNFKTLSSNELNNTMGGGGYYVIITLPNGNKIRVHVRE